jgi:DNA polymerase-3 subunit gamma/tau
VDRKWSSLAYISLYRKYRPRTFDEVIGQEYVTRTLSNSLRSGNFSHAYLFTGPRGTGKTSTARILAKALNCEEGPTPDPCNHCRSCVEITEGTSVDVIEIDAASNRGIDDIRDLRERVVFSPASSRIKVYILDEAHMLTPPAFNALLKMLEEPPAHVVFVLATTEPHKMPPTILSRCQRFDFRSVPMAELAEHLARIVKEEGIEASEGALRLIARRARGSARDALVTLEQAISYGDGVIDEAEVAGFLGLIEDEMLSQLGDSLARGDTAGAIAMVERAYEEGRDPVQFAREAQEHFRRVFLLQYADLSPEDLEVDESTYESIRRQAESLSPNRTFHFISALREAVKEMQEATSTRLVLEGTLIGMARSELDVSPEALSARLGKLEGELEKYMRRSAGEAPEMETARPAGRGKGKRPAVAVPREEIAEKTETSVEAGDEPIAGAAEAEDRDVEAPTVALLDMAAIRRAWPQVKERVKEKKITTHAFLLEGKPLDVKGDELTIVFPPDRSFHRGELEKEDHRKVLEEALEEVLGVSMTVRTRLDEPTEKQGGSVDAAAKEPMAVRSPGRPFGDAEVGPGSLDEEALEVEREKEAESEKVEERIEDRADTDTLDAGKVKLVKDVFGAEMIEEIKLNE